MRARISEQNFVEDKQRDRSRAVARQGSLTQYSAKFAGKTGAHLVQGLSRRFVLLSRSGASLASNILFYAKNY